MKKTLLVITIFNQLEYTKKVEQSIPEIENMDVLFVDDCSQEPNVEYLQSKNRNVIQKEKGRGLTDSWNIAYRYYLDKNYDNFILSNNDVILNKYSIDNIINALNTHTLVCPMSTYHGAGHNKNLQKIEKYYPELKKQSENPDDHSSMLDKLVNNQNIKMPMFNGFFFGMNKQIIQSSFDKENLFNPQNTNIGQEDDLARRLKEPPVLNTASFIFHYKAVTLNTKNRNSLQDYHNVEFNWFNYYTDKLDHGYNDIYDKYLLPIRKNVKTVLEIGSRPGSAKLWLDYFPNATVYSADLKPFTIDNDRHHFVSMDQGKPETYINLPSNRIDVIIDDGPHTAPEQLMSLDKLLPQTNMFYIIEDLHTTDGVNPEEYKTFMKDSDVSANTLLREWSQNIFIEHKYIDNQKRNKLKIFFERGTKIRWTSGRHTQKKPSEIIFIRQNDEFK